MRRLLVFVAAGLCIAAPAPALINSQVSASALPESGLGFETRVNRRVRQIERLEQPLRQAREGLEQCAGNACLLPSEAVAIAFTAGPDRKTQGRFILDVRGGGPGDPNQLRNERLFFLNSEPGFRDFGVLILAIEPDVLDRLLGPEAGGTRGDVPGSDAGQRRLKHSSVKQMRTQFEGKRLIVDGEVGLQRIEFVDWITMGQRNGDGYHQVWVRVTSPDQITVVSAD